MSQLKIVNSISVVRNITDKEPRTVGATIYVDGELSEYEIKKIKDELNPTKVRVNEDIGPTTTAIDL